MKKAIKNSGKLQKNNKNVFLMKKTFLVNDEF